MKIGIISDIHSNYRAFKACLDYFEREKVDYYLLLGDYVSDTTCPEKVMEMIYSLKANHRVLMVRGNREEYFLNDLACDKGWKKGASSTGNLLYTKERLTHADYDMFEKLPIADTFYPEGFPSITFCHGSPDSARELVYMDTETCDSWLGKINTDYLIAGHTHQRCIYRHNGRTYINTGACGIPIHNATVAECVMLTGVCKDGKSDWKIDMLSLPYDSQALIDEIFSSGLYDYGHWFINSNIQTLTTGIDKASDMVKEAHRIMMSESDASEDDVPTEEHFAQAAGRLNIPDYADNQKPVFIRMATADDAGALADIYSYYVENTAITFEYIAPSAEEFKNRIRNVRKDFPYYVAVKDGRILGYAYASKFRTRAAYGWSSELSIYVEKDAHRLGIGSLLLEAVEETLKRQGIVNFYAISTDSPVESEYIHGEGIPFYQKHGYEKEGRLSGVGVKFGQWFDTVYMVKRLNNRIANPPSPKPYFTDMGTVDMTDFE